MIQPYNKSKGVSFMISSGFSGDYGRGALILMERDPDAPRNGFTAWSYTEALDEMLTELWAADSLLLQDNARVHTAAHTIAWLQKNGVNLLTIPPYSPDLNPIQHLWSHLKKQLYIVAPELDSMLLLVRHLKQLCHEHGMQ
jgi:hypothetical protein